MHPRTGLPLASTLLALLLLSSPAPAHAAEEPAAPGGAKAEMAEGKADKPAEKVLERAVRTQHSLVLDGQKIAYTATTGTLVLKDENGKDKASLFYVAYTRDGVKDSGERPVTFSFNGGPGAAALWVHLGAFGPKMVAQGPEGLPLPPPARLVENPNTILDVTDLVFVDPVSTGYSRPAPGEDAKQFHGVDEDAAAVGEFIRLWLTRNERWGSPKFLAGESYGTTRSAALSAHLQDRYGLQLNGIVLISTVLNWQNQAFDTGNDLGYVIYLPTYAATAWYHKKLAPELSGDLGKLLEEVEAFALGEYVLALHQGDWLPAEKRREVARKVARYTGLSPEYVERANLRIEHIRFCKELLRDQGKTVGRLDSRFTGDDIDAAGEYFLSDPSLVAVDGPYVTAMQDYLRRELNYKEDQLVYERLANVFPWKFGPGGENRYVNVAEHLRQAMIKNPDLKVLVASGYYDLATPYFDGDYTVAHLGLPEHLRGNVKTEYYESGHMMYIRQVDHRKFKKDVADFIRWAAKPRR
jgi:carboxypeptidase C (cathepsin A)